MPLPIRINCSGKSETDTPFVIPIAIPLNKVIVARVAKIGVTFKTAIKPTASIGKPQKTVNISTMEEVTLELVGRHDPCIVHRVIHVINAMTSYAILEIIARTEGVKWIN